MYIYISSQFSEVFFQQQKYFYINIQINIFLSRINYELLECSTFLECCLYSCRNCDIVFIYEYEILAIKIINYCQTLFVPQNKY